MAERDALAGGGGLDVHRGIAEAGAALDVDAADAGGLQPVAPVRALVLARDLVVQQGVMAQVLRRAQRVRAFQQLWAAHREYLVAQQQLGAQAGVGALRSEEHTSELQSLMR